MSKELPQEVIRVLNNRKSKLHLYPYLFEYLNEGAQIAWGYALKEMSGYRLSAENDAEHLEAKDKEIADQNEQIEKLKGLLKESFCALNRIALEAQGWEAVKIPGMLTNAWNSLRKEHNITP